MTEATPRFVWEEGAEIPAGLREDWLDLMQRSRADVCFDPDWLSAWAPRMGTGARMLRLCVRRGERLEAVLPFAIFRLRIGPLVLRVARLAGTDPNAVLLRLPAEEEAAAPALAAALERLLGQEGCVGVSFTPVSAEFPAAEAIRAACARAGLALRDEAAGSHTIFRLPESFDAYLAGLSKKRRNQFRRDLRQLGEGREPRPCTVHPDRAAFEAFRAFHDAQWQASGRGGHFTDWPGSADFHAALSESLSPRGIMRLETLHDAAAAPDETPLASQLCYVSGGVCWWRLPARRLDPELDKLGLGKLGLVVMIERLIGEGVREIEAGAGDYGYKLTWGGEAVELRRMIAHAPGRARPLNQLLAWGELLHLLYYRIWFLKLAPKLSQRTGWKRRPLWKSWIRTRL